MGGGGVDRCWPLHPVVEDERPNSLGPSKAMEGIAKFAISHPLESKKGHFQYKSSFEECF